MPSGSFMNWGEAGKGEWITLYAHGGHIYMVVAGLRFDTSGRGETGLALAEGHALAVAASPSGTPRASSPPPRAAPRR